MKKVFLLLFGISIVAANVDISDFFPFGVANGDQYLDPGDDTSSPEQTLSTPFNFFNTSHSSLWVNVNGAISFVEAISTYTPSCQPVSADYRMISPYWADVDTRYESPTPYSGISFRESTSQNVLQQARAEVLNAFRNLTDISLTWAYIVTYNNVTFYLDDPNRTIRNTFQVTLTSNGVNSFAIFYYNKVQWTTGSASGGDQNGLGGTPAQVGFDAGDGVHRAMLSVSCTPDVINIGTMSNAGKPGVFVYQVDGDQIVTPAPVTIPTTTTSQPPTSVPYMTTPAPTPSDSRSDGIGTLCSHDVGQAWLDLVFVVDTSKSFSETALSALGGQVGTFMSKFTFGQNGNHTTRGAIVTYATDATVRYGLNDTTNTRAFIQQLLKLKTYASPDDTGGNVQGGLQTAYQHLLQQKTYRKPAIILIAAAYSDEGFQGGQDLANKIKGDGITIVTISFEQFNGNLTQILANLSSFGYAYSSSQDGLYNSLPLALTQINCYCPPNSKQFTIVNSSWKNFTAYADCIYGFSEDTAPSIAELICDPGVLVSVTSQAKLDFITDQVVPFDLPNKKKFTIGLHRADDGTWKWFGYNSDTDEFSLGSFPSWAQQPSSDNQFAYEWNFSGFNFTLMPGSDDPLPYICQSRACDAAYHCDMTQP